MTDRPDRVVVRCRTKRRAIKQRLTRLAAASILLGLVIAMAWWNMVRMPGTSHRGPLPPADDELERRATELRHHVTQLAEEIGERNVIRRPSELADAASYIQGQLAKFGYDVKRQEYEIANVTCCNLEAEIVGTSQPDEIVIVGAHYDSVVGAPGANDNASGVGAILNLANEFSPRKCDRTLRFVAFVNEEPPYFQTNQMGSRVYARRCRQRGENVTAMLSLETIGYFTDSPRSQKYPSPFGLLYPSTGNFIAFVGNTQSRELVRQVVAVFRRHEAFPSEGGALPGMISGVGFSDHWSFWKEGYHALMVTDTAMYRYPHYHESEDTVEKIDFARMARVVRGLESVLKNLVDVDSGDGGRES